MSTVEWVREPTNRWLPCTSCRKAGRWLLEILGHPTGGPICDTCRAEMQAAWDGATVSAASSSLVSSEPFETNKPSSAQTFGVSRAER